MSTIYFKIRSSSGSLLRNNRGQLITGMAAGANPDNLEHQVSLIIYEFLYSGYTNLQGFKLMTLTADQSTWEASTDYIATLKYNAVYDGTSYGVMSIEQVATLADL